MPANRKFIELKYRIAWLIGAFIAFVLYFSGIVTLYSYFCRKCLKYSRCVVLMYHRVNNDETSSDITVSVKNFEQQIKYLKENYKVISLDELIEKNKHPFKRDTIAITFDDGFKDNYTHAYPLLKVYNVPATIFIITSLIGKNDEMLDSEEIWTMQKDGIGFGAHTLTHKVLSEVDRTTAFFEISGSKTALEDMTGERIKYFAYPKGKKRDFTEENMVMVKESGYDAAFCTENGCIRNTSNIFALNRIGIRNCPLFVFKTRVSGIFENRLLYLLRKYLRLT